MKLYYHPISHNCRRVLATIYENGLKDVDLVKVDLFKGEHTKPDFLAVNPNGKIPVLVDGDFILWESTAIMQYLSSNSSLWPPSKVRYDIIRWQCWGIAHWGPAIGKVVFERLVKPMVGGGDADEDLIASGTAEFERFAAVLDAHLNNRDWLVGEGITLADLSIASNLTFAAAARLDSAPYANITRWYGTIQQRDSWQKSAPPALD